MHGVKWSCIDLKGRLIGFFIGIIDKHRLSVCSLKGLFLEHKILFFELVSIEISDKNKKIDTLSEDFCYR